MRLEDAKDPKHSNMKPFTNLLRDTPAPDKVIGIVDIDTNVANNTVLCVQVIVDSRKSALILDHTETGNGSHFKMEDSIPMYMALAVGKNTQHEGIEDLVPGDLFTIRDNTIYETSKEYRNTLYRFEYPTKTFTTHVFARINTSQVGERIKSYTSAVTKRRLLPGNYIEDIEGQLRIKP